MKNCRLCSFIICNVLPVHFPINISFVDYKNVRVRGWTICKCRLSGGTLYTSAICPGGHFTLRHRCRRTECPPLKLSPRNVVLGPQVPLGQLVLGSAVPPTLYHEPDIIFHCAIICSCFTQRGTSVLLGACSRGHAVLGPTVTVTPLRKAGPRTTQTLSSEFDVTW